jgi:hypothetical protein
MTQSDRVSTFMTERTPLQRVAVCFFGLGGQSWPSAVVAEAIIALVGLFFWKTVDSDDFTTIWSAVGTVVGVVTGAIPAYFLRQDAKEGVGTSGSHRRGGSARGR